MQTLLSKLNSLPPYKVRLLARHKRQRQPIPMNNDEIAVISGLALETVRRVSHLRTWNSVTVETMLRFCAACGVELLQQKRALQFERETRGFETAAHLNIYDTHSHNRKFYEAIRLGKREWRNVANGNAGT